MNTNPATVLPPIETDDNPPPGPLTGAERQKVYRERDPERWKRRERTYKHANSMWQSNGVYLSRDIMAWDGEGITRPDGSHDYVMFAAKSTNGATADLVNLKGLATAAIFEFILETAALSPGAINVIYGGSYDFNMWLRDLPRHVAESVYRKKFVVWRNYRIGWRQGKSFYLARVNEHGKRIDTGVTIYDVVSFFQCPFVKACDEYLGERFSNREMIVTNKALRSSFTLADVPTVRVYNDAELDNLLMLVTELRARLNKCHLRPRRWDGPGAVAAALMLREDVKSYKGDLPLGAARAARVAYAGGRFEVLKFGHVEAPAYEYDINSAYPAALRQVPDLSSGTWRKVSRDPGPQPFALYHVRYRGNRSDIPGALFRRDPNGTICYPMAVTGWYWSPEIDTAREYCARGYGSMEIMSAWVYEPATEDKPFKFIDPLYRKRKALKAGGDGAHVGIKLALNSLYGKLCQQVGAERNPDGTWKIPSFHQLEWAGFTTSWCRATILRACLDNLDDVIAFETDAVFTRVPLPVTLGAELGDFEATEFTDLTYVQSGLYFGNLTDGRSVSKTRGVDRGTLTRETVLDRLAEPLARDRYATAPLTRFVGLGVAVSQSWERWRRWETQSKAMILEPSGKRIHLECDCMVLRYDESGRAISNGIELGYWHTTACPVMSDAESSPFPVVWINPNPNMKELEDLRNEPNDYESDF